MIGVEGQVDRLSNVDEVSNGLLESQKLKVFGGQIVVWRRGAPESVCSSFSKQPHEDQRVTYAPP